MRTEIKFGIRRMGIMSSVVAERITTATIEELAGWAAFDYQIGNFSFAEVETIFKKCQNSLAIARTDKPDYRAWIARQSFMDEALANASDAVDQLTRLNTKLSLEIEEGIVQNIRSCISKMQQLTQVIVSSLNELRLVEAELFSIIGKII